MRKHRLARLDRLFTNQPAFFVTCCTHDRQRVLASVAVHESFRLFAEQAAPRGIFVGRYVLMPDHLHLFAALAVEARSLSTWVKSLKNHLSKTLRQLDVPAPHWQKGFFDHVIRSEESYAEKWTYAAQNPVRAGLVKHTDEWPYQGEIHILSTL